MEKTLFYWVFSFSVSVCFRPFPFVSGVLGVVWVSRQGARKAQRLVFLSFWCVPFVESFRLFLCGSFGMDGSFEVVLDNCDGFFSGVGVSVCNRI